MTLNKNIAIFGCKETSKFIIESLTIAHIITISPQLGSKNQVADYCDLTEIANSLKISLYQAESYALKSEKDINYITSLNIDIAFVIGWQRLLPEKILNSFSIGAFGMHGSSMNLPLGRGRSPMNWSIIEGKKVFYTNLFKYDAGIDSGDIVDTFKFNITDKDTAETMHLKNTLAMNYLIKRNIGLLTSNKIVYKKQRDIQPSYYPKRTPEDGIIDWQQDVYFIERFIRAVTKPFDGAFSYINNEKVIIYSAQVFDHNDFGYENELEGKIVEVFPKEKFLIKCFSGLLLVNEYLAQQPIKKGMVFNNGNKEIKIFTLNKYGNHDLYDES